MAGDDAVARVGGAGIDAEDDHAGRDSARRPGRLPGDTNAARRRAAGVRAASWAYDDVRRSTSGRRPAACCVGAHRRFSIVPRMRLSVLDQSPISEGSTGRDALANTIDLARLADDLGYHRYWVAEHHGGADARRPGARGADRPARRGDAADPRRQRRRDAAALQPAQGRRDVQPARRAVPRADRPRPRPRRGHRPDDDVRAAARPPPGRARRLPRAARRAARLPRGRRCRPTTRSRGSPRSLPGRPEAPEPWLLGSSPQSAIWAAQLGLPYAFADFINRDGAGIATDYQRALRPRRRGSAAPRTAVAVLGARRRDRGGGVAARPPRSRMAMAMLRRGRLIAVPPVEQALRFLEAEGEPAIGGRAGSRRARPSRSAPGSRRVAQQYGADEVIVVTITYDHGARRRSYELLAEAFGLERGAADRPPSRRPARGPRRRRRSSRAPRRRRRAPPARRRAAAACVAPSSSSCTRVFGTCATSALSTSIPASSSAAAHGGEVGRLADDLEHVVVEPDVLGAGVDRDHQVVLGVALGVDHDDALLVEQVGDRARARRGCRRAWRTCGGPRSRCGCGCRSSPRRAARRRPGRSPRR